MSATKPFPSIDEVAELAGVSIATVSRVLNNTKKVSDDTRLKVEQAVATLGYHQNAAGRSLARARSSVILVLVPDFSNPFYAQIVQGIDTVTTRHGYRTMLSDTSAGGGSLQSALGSLYNRVADGVINLAQLDDDPTFISRIKDLAWVNCSEFKPTKDLPYVSIDHRQAAIDAVRFLINRGHQDIGLITVDEGSRWAKLRQEGYEMALKQAGLKVRPALIKRARHTDYLDGSQAATSLLTLAAPPSAVFAVSDTLAIGAIKAFRKAGRRVPEDIAVIGFDDLPLSAVFEPALTTIAQPMRELGATAASMLLDKIDGQRPQSRILDHQLVVRDST